MACGTSRTRAVKGAGQREYLTGLSAVNRGTHNLEWLTYHTLPTKSQGSVSVWDRCGTLLDLPEYFMYDRRVYSNTHTYCRTRLDAYLNGTLSIEDVNEVCTQETCIVKKFPAIVK